MREGMVKLSEVADLNPESLGVGTPPDLEFTYVDLASVHDGKVNWSETGRVTYGEAPSRARRKVRKGDAIFGTVRPLNQSHASFSEFIESVVVSTGFSVIRPVPTRMDSGYLHYLLFSASILRQSNMLAAGSNYPAVTDRDVACFNFWLPSLAEQRRIADVLGAVDERIAIDQRELKKSVLIQSATFGDLMSVRGGAWPELTVANVASKTPGSSTIGPFGSNLIADDYLPSGVPVIFVRDIKVSGFSWKSGVFVSKEKARELGAHLVRPGDLVVTKMGLPPCIAAEYPSHMGPGVVTSDVIRVRPDAEVTTAKWLALTINHPTFEVQVRGIAGGVTRSKVTLADFRGLKVKVPSLDEQYAIVNLLDAVRDKIEIQRERLVKLRTLKQALMDNLLTGRVRVSVGSDV